MMPPHTPWNAVKLSDHGGQYMLILKCGECGHTREAQPAVFARIAGWEAPLTTIVARLRCSRCNARQCSVTVRRPTKRDG